MGYDSLEEIERAEAELLANLQREQRETVREFKPPPTPKRRYSGADLIHTILEMTR